jgi:hypothetical protein
MDAAKAYNIFEVFLWLGFSLIFFIPAVKRGEKHRLFCVLGGLGFVFASLSELAEVYSGAWWRPWWLLAWKASFGPIFILMFLWYRKIKLADQATKNIDSPQSEKVE